MEIYRSNMLLIFTTFIAAGDASNATYTKQFLGEHFSPPSEDSEHRLMSYLFHTPNLKDVRPVKNKAQPVHLQFGIAYVQLNDLNDKDQILSSNVWVRQTWINEFLVWDPKQFQGIKTVNVAPAKVWLPDVTLYNNAVNGKYAGTLYNFKTKVQLFHNGTNVWYSPATIKSGCDVDITWFPFDYQNCKLVFGSWAYHGFEIDIHSDSITADLDFYNENSEFQLLAAPVEKIVNRFSCCPEPYPILAYQIVFKRNAGFHFYHIILPSLSMTFASLLTFISPHLTGERIGLAIESFLSLSFLLVLVSEEMPVNSDVTPMISKFLLSCMIFISATLLCNLVSCNLCGKTKVPLLLYTVLIQYVAPMIGYSELKKTCLENREKISTKEQIIPLPCKSREEATVRNIRDMVRLSKRKKICKSNNEFWCCLAKVLDRLFLGVFAGIHILTTTFVLLTGFRQHHKFSQE